MLIHWHKRKLDREKILAISLKISGSAFHSHFTGTTHFKYLRIQSVTSVLWSSKPNKVLLLEKKEKGNSGPTLLEKANREVRNVGVWNNK
jgi:hypothetical protein